MHVYHDEVTQHWRGVCPACGTRHRYPGFLPAEPCDFAWPTLEEWTGFLVLMGGIGVLALGLWLVFG